MATADTAKLIASLELKDGFSKPLTGASRALAKFDAKLTDTQGRAFKAGQQIGTGIKNGAKIAAIGLGLLATQVIAGLRQLANLEEVTVATATVIKSTGGVAGQTADSVRKLSEAYENLNATMDDKVIQSGANMLLTFTNIRKEAFEPALLAALNLNTAMGGGEAGLQATIIKVGKALNDPAKGLAALSKAGVLFTDQQKKQIIALQKSGDLLGAQKIVLAELGTEFGGRFVAQGKTATATIAGIGDAVEDLQKGLATALFPTVQRLLPQFRELLGSPRFAAAVSTLGDKIAGLFSDANIAEGSRAISGLFKAAQTAAPIIQNAAEVTGRVVKTAVDLFRSLPPELQTLAVAGLAINKLTGGLVTNLAGGLISAVLSGFKGLMHVNAGIVQVTGAVGAGGLPVSPAGATGWTALFGLVLPAAIIAGLAKGASDFTNDDFRKAGIDSNFRPPIGVLPYGIDSSIHNLLEIIRLAQGGGRAPGEMFGPSTSFPMGPPTSVNRAQMHATGALAGAMTGAARATHAYATQAILAGRSIQQLRDQEKAARGSKNRIAFVAGGKPSDTVPVADYLTRQFAVSQAPFYRNMDNAKRALEAIKADQRRAIRTGDTVTARKLGADIDALQATIKANKPVVNVTVPVTTNINGRIIGAAISRYTSTVGNLHLTGYGGAVG